jgi:ABC-type multidrug transport system ATPase subunit
MLTITRPHLLLLDEPTNNLDMDSISTLKSALKAYQGAYLIASHDMNFVKDICMDIYHVIPYKQQQQQLLQLSMQQRAKNTSQVKKNSGSSTTSSSISSCGSVRKLEDGVDEYREIVRKAVESQKKYCT